MSLWKELSTDQLYVILECKNIEKINKWLLRFANNGLEEQFHLSIVKARLKCKHALSQHEIMQSLFTVVTSEASYPAIILLAIAQATVLSLLALSILTIGTAVLTLAAGIFFYVAAYSEYKIEYESNLDDLDFSQIKLECTKEIIRRHEEPTIQNENQSSWNIKPFTKPFIFRNDNRLRRMKSALASTMLTAGSLFAIYYLMVAVVIAAFGVTTALLGPIGIGVAIGVTLAIGLYAGYKQYQSLYNNEKLAAFKEHQEHQLEKKCNLCNELRGRPQHKKLYSSQQTTESTAGQKTQKQAYFEATSNLQRRNFMNKKPIATQPAAHPTSNMRPN